MGLPFQPKTGSQRFQPLHGPAKRSGAPEAAWDQLADRPLPTRALRVLPRPVPILSPSPQPLDGLGKLPVALTGEQAEWLPSRSPDRSSFVLERSPPSDRVS